MPDNPLTDNPSLLPPGLYAGPPPSIATSIDPSLRIIRLTDPDTIERAANYALRFGPGVIKAWHGTPHLFSQFADEAIGSGQGAQTYGWGHYVAGAKPTAESYRRELSGPSQWKYVSEQGPLSTFDRIRLMDFTKKLPGAEWSPDDLSEYSALNYVGLHVPGTDIDKIIEQGKGEPFLIGPESLKWLDENRDKFSVYQPGHLLEVHVKPGEDELLDWDNSLNEQSPAIRDKINSLFNRILPKSFFAQYPGEINKWNGEDIYRELSMERSGVNSLGQKGASKMLHEAGIPGIKYLDQMSRGAAENQTRNYVIFDPSNLVIKSRNGIEMIPVEGDPFAQTR